MNNQRNLIATEKATAESKKAPSSLSISVGEPLGLSSNQCQNSGYSQAGSTYLCISRSGKILFELLIEHLHHTRILHAVHDLVRGLLPLFLAQIVSLDDLRRGQMTFRCQPC